MTTVPASDSAVLPAQVAAVLFDLDNTLVRSEPAWFAAVADLWTEAGGDPSGKGVLGGTVDHLVSEFVTEYPDANRAQVEGRLLGLLARHLESATVALPGASELLTRLAALVPIAVASNSPSEMVRQLVSSLGWAGLVTAALGTEDVTAPKPAPDLYLAAASRCDADIADCVIFEDSPMGALAAATAGAFVVTVGADAVGHGNLSVGSLLDPRVAEWYPEAVPSS